MLRIYEAYLDGGREPAIGGVHWWAIDIARKKAEGKDLEPTYSYITWAVKQEPKDRADHT